MHSRLLSCMLLITGVFIFIPVPVFSEIFVLIRSTENVIEMMQFNKFDN